MSPMLYRLSYPSSSADTYSVNHIGFITYPGVKETKGKRKTLRSSNVGLEPTTLGLRVPCSTA